MDQKSGEARAIRVSVVTILGNVVLTILKLAAGLVAHSGAMVSDAVHSASDVLSTFVVIAGVKLAGKEADREHPFGYGRMETIAGFVVALLVVLMGLELGKSAVEKILHPDTVQSGPVVVGILLVSIFAILLGVTVLLSTRIILAALLAVLVILGVMVQRTQLSPPSGGV